MTVAMQGWTTVRLGPPAAGAGGKDPRARSARRPRRQARPAWVGVAVVVALVVSLTAKLFVWPAQDAVAGVHADAVVVLGGPGPRWQVALELAREHAAGVMLLSVPSVEWNCPHVALPGVKLECFSPKPSNTMGEVRFAASQARAHGWHSLIVVSAVAQDTRARVRLKRCFSGSVYVVTARPSLATWAYELVYEWGALAKALVFQRAC